jgi:cyanate permease
MVEQAGLAWPEARRTSTFWMMMGAVVCGALLMGIGFDRTGSYTLPLLGFLGAVVLAIVLFRRLGPYRYVPAEACEIVADTQVSVAAG